MRSARAVTVAVMLTIALFAPSTVAAQGPERTNRFAAGADRPGEVAVPRAMAPADSSTRWVWGAVVGGLIGAGLTLGLVLSEPENSGESSWFGPLPYVGLFVVSTAAGAAFGGWFVHTAEKAKDAERAPARGRTTARSLRRIQDIGAR